MQTSSVSTVLLATCLLVLPAAQGLANSNVAPEHRDMALLLHNRIAGVPPDQATLAEMIELLEQAKKKEAAALATESSAFYNLKLRNMFSAWSNTAGYIDVDLNDMVATMIGLVRDDIPFNEVLSGDYLYTGDDSLGNYHAANNDLYTKLQKKDLQQTLVKRKQSEVFAGIKGHLPPNAQAGVLSLRAFGNAYYSAGTNRRATAFTLKYFLCHEMEALHDPTISDEKVRPDVSRAPGGDANLFNNRCKGCHSGMDALSGWNVYYDFQQNKIVYHQQHVQTKVSRNFYVYPQGHQPVDDSFVNLWTTGQNTTLGWGASTRGRGAQDYGRMLTDSEAFSACMATHAYEQVCLLAPETKAEKALRDQLAGEFKSNNYSMKKLFAATAVACLLGED